MVKRIDDAAKAVKQIDKFKETAKQVETDNSVEKFDAALKRVSAAKAPRRAKR